MENNSMLERVFGYNFQALAYAEELTTVNILEAIT